MLLTEASRTTMRRILTALTLFLALAALAAPAFAQSSVVILSTTTSTQDSGLLDVLVPMFEKKSGMTVKTISVGTGQASGSSIELFTGLRKFWGDRIRPFLGAGVMLIQSEVELNTNRISQSEDDTSMGGWVDTGVLWRIHPRFHLGVDARFSSATAYFGTNLGGRDRIEAGGIYLGVLLGTGW